MASNGLEFYAKRGKCRICQRTRATDEKVYPVGEVRHGYATGHVWQCIDEKECEDFARKKIAEGAEYAWKIELALKEGRFRDYRIYP